MEKSKYLLLCLMALLAASCATSNHGSFVTSTYKGQKQSAGASLGKVTGESRQTWILYLLPHGEAPSTLEAIEDAKSKQPGTRYLSDVTIDDRMLWNIGYSEQVIRVEGEAHR